MDMHGKPFTKKYENQVTEMLRLFLDYMKSIWVQAEQNGEVGSGSGMGQGDNQPDDIKFTTGGYPIIPDCVQGSLSKARCEKLLRTFLAQHYCKLIAFQMCSDPESHSVSKIWHQAKQVDVFHFCPCSKTHQASSQMTAGHPELSSGTQGKCTSIIFYRHFGISTSDKRSLVLSRLSTLHCLWGRTRKGCSPIIQSTLLVLKHKKERLVQRKPGKKGRRRQINWMAC